MNEKIKNVINKFLSNYMDDDNFLGAILTGSYATGNNNPNSDVDLFIITDSSTTWRERGNELVDGYMVEYFINPVRQVMKELKESIVKNEMATVMMFKNSKILYDKTGIVNDLVNLANEKFKQDIENVSSYQYQMNCYSVWNAFDELDSKYNSNGDIDYAYYIFLDNTIKAYFQNNRIPMLPTSKIERLLMDKEYRKRYNVKEMPDQEFIDKLINCFKEKDYQKKYLYAKELYNYFMSKSNNFDINHFSYRSNI